MLDLFSGIGGFHKGFEQAGYEFDWVGFSEIDKYASAVYRHRFPKAVEIGDITVIQPERDLPDHIDILCGGFPCQAFSVAGKRKGFNDTRGTLFFEIARILRYYRDIEKPIPCVVLENVKGLLHHDSGRTFATIYRVLTDIGYTVECELLNTRNFSIPQNRERIYIVCYLGDRGRPQVFPIGENCKEVNGIQRQYTNTLKARYTATGDGSYIIESELNAQKKESVIAHTTHPRSGDSNQGGTGPLSRNDGNSYCLDTGNAQAVEIESKIRRLTPIETCRLQGFPDDWNAYGEFDGKVVEMSDTQRYKQCGNAVTVDVVQAVAQKVKRLMK
tara:strand:+ start:2595 stop:3584 length:990 start_codon:yes stop_codon:yes gene_type:complete